MDRRTAKSRRDRKLKRDLEVERTNAIYTLEVLAESKNEDKETEG
jgi:hypothetical protein